MSVAWWWGINISTGLLLTTFIIHGIVHIKNRLIDLMFFLFSLGLGAIIIIGLLNVNSCDTILINNEGTCSDLAYKHKQWFAGLLAGILLVNITYPLGKNYKAPEKLI